MYFQIKTANCLSHQFQFMKYRKDTDVKHWSKFTSFLELRVSSLMHVVFCMYFLFNTFVGLLSASACTVEGSKPKNKFFAGLKIFIELL